MIGALSSIFLLSRSCNTAVATKHLDMEQVEKTESIVTGACVSRL